MSRSKAEEAATSRREGKRRFRVTRRGFLIGTGIVGGGVVVGWRWGLPAARLQIARQLDNAGAPGGVSGPPEAWFELEPGQPLRLYLSKVEMGQGIHTALAQIAAEELELQTEQIEVRPAPSTRGLDDAFGTGASTSVSSSWGPLREAAAMLREMMLQAAATRFGVARSEVVASEGRILRVGASNESIAYGDLAQDVLQVEAPDDVPAFKPRSEYREVGRSRPRVDLEAKLAGQGGYGLDARVPGMHYGAVARPPVLGATLRNAGEGTARDVPGVTQVVIKDGFAGVVATRRSAAHAGVAALELSWNMPEEPVTQEEVDEATTVRGEGVTVQREGNASRPLRERVDVRSEYRSAMAVHAHLEPQAALVDVRPEGVQAWVSTQSPTAVRNALAELLGRDEADVEVTATWLGGGFGRRLNVEVASEAARLANAAGVPVHVAWTREDEFQYGYLRPPVHNVLEARVEQGRIVAWRHRQASGDVAFPFFPAVAGAVLGADFGAWRGATSPYGAMGARETIAERVRLRVPTGWWRGLGLLPNVFATESFMDEIAAQVGMDPLAFRLAHLGDDPLDRRLAAVLEAAAEAIGWDTPREPGRGLGIAVSVDVGTCVAQATEVVLTANGPRLERIVSAVDAGLVVNPDGVRAQTEGSITWGISSLFHEEARIEGGRIASSNFDTYRLARASDIPEVEVILVESDDEPRGVGEPPLGPVAASIANAIVAAGGERPRTLPIQTA